MMSRLAPSWVASGPPWIRLAAVLLLVGVVTAAPLRGQDGERLVVAPLSIDTFTLDNGLRVIVSEDHSTPIVAVELWYHVGSAHEPEGRAGFAHLFEHLVLEDTEGMADGAFAEMIMGAGGTFNGATDADRTAFREVLPANRVNLALWSHAQRMTRPRLSPTGFATQREVVKEERRLRIDNQPYAPARLSLDTIAFRHYPPYRRGAVGAMDDLDAAGVDEAKDFHARFYGPNHAVLTVVGAVRGDAVRALVEEAFGAIGRAPGIDPLPPPPAAPRSDGERRRVEVDPLAPLPLVWMGFNLPPADHPDHRPLAVLARVLAGGESSRLRRRLVTEEAAALDVVAEIDRRREGGLLVIGAAPNEAVTPEHIEQLLGDEFRALARDGVGSDEVEAARNRLLTAAVMERATVESKGGLLQRHTLLHGSPFTVDDELARIEGVTADDVRRVAATYLTPANRTVVIVRSSRTAGREE